MARPIGHVGLETVWFIEQQENSVRDLLDTLLRFLMLRLLILRII
jgi:hypothetical protein